MVADGSTGEATVASGDIAVKYATTDSTHAPTVSVKSGLTTTPAAVTLTGYASGKWNNAGANTFASVLAKGTEAVVIEVDDSAVTPSYTITNKLTAGPASGFGVKGASDGAKSLTFTLADATNMVKDGNASFTVAGLTSITEAFQYEATITLSDGRTLTADIGNATIGTDGTVVFTIQNKGADVDITDLEISVKTEKLAVESYVFNDAKTTLTVTFNMDVDETTAKAGFTLNAGTQISATKTADVQVSGKVVTISVIGGEFIADVPMLGTIQAVDNDANTAAAKTLTLPTP